MNVSGQESNPEYDLTALADRVRRDAHPSFFPLMVFAVIALVELIFRIVSGDLWTPFGFVWDVLPVALAGIWITLRMTESRRGMRSGSTSWGVASAVTVIGFFPLAIACAIGGGPIVTGITVLIIGTIARNVFLTKAGTALMTAGIVALFITPVANQAAGGHNEVTCLATPIATNTADSVAASDSAICDDGNEPGPYSVAALPGALIVPVVFTGAAILSWRREHYAKV
jgi:hypothetical protein